LFCEHYHSMAFRNLTRSFLQLAQRRPIMISGGYHRFFSSMQQQQQQHLNPLRFQRCLPTRSFSSIQTNDDAYRDLSTFLEKEIKLEKTAQKHPSKMPKIEGFEVEATGPEVTLTRKSGQEKVVVKFNVTNTVNASESDHSSDTDEHAHQQQGGGEPGTSSQTSSQLKSRPTFTVELNRGGQTLSFLCSYLPDDYPDARQHLPADEQGTDAEKESMLEDFQIDEFTIHDGEWKDTIYSADCSVIDGELYDKLLNLLEECGIGEEFANQLMDFATAHEHRQYIGLLEKLHQFVKK